MSEPQQAAEAAEATEAVESAEVVEAIEAPIVVEPSVLAARDLARDALQAVLAHEVRAHAREVAFVAAREALEQQAGDRQVQHRVAQELEALVVVGAMAAVRQRALHQRRAGKAVAQALLQGFQAGVAGEVHGHYFERPSYFSSRYTGPNTGSSLSWA